MLRRVPAGRSPGCCGTVVWAMRTWPSSPIPARRYRRCEPICRISSPPARSIARFTSRALTRLSLPTRRNKCLKSRHPMRGGRPEETSHPASPRDDALTVRFHRGTSASREPSSGPMRTAGPHAQRQVEQWPAAALEAAVRSAQRGQKIPGLIGGVHLRAGERRIAATGWADAQERATERASTPRPGSGHRPTSSHAAQCLKPPLEVLQWF